MAVLGRGGGLSTWAARLDGVVIYAAGILFVFLSHSSEIVSTFLLYKYSCQQLISVGCIWISDLASWASNG